MALLNTYDPFDTATRISTIKEAARKEFTKRADIDQLLEGIEHAVSVSSMDVLGQFRQFYAKLLTYREL